MGREKPIGVHGYHLFALAKWTSCRRGQSGLARPCPYAATASACAAGAVAVRFRKSAARCGCEAADDEGYAMEELICI